MANERAHSPEIIRYQEKWAKDQTSRVFAQLADAYRKEGMLEEAIQVCQEGLQHHPTYVSARMILGRAYLEKGALEEAAAQFEKVLEISADNVLAHRMLGDTRHRQGRLGEAAQQYEAVLALIALDRETRQLLAEVQAGLTAQAPAPAPDMAVHAPGPEPVPAEEEVTGVLPPEVLALEAGPPLPETLLGEGVREEATAVAAASAGGIPAGELPATETLADLYAAQGHREQAAEIYQELLAKSPGQSRLESKLAAIEGGSPPVSGTAAPRRARATETAVASRALPGDSADASELLATLTAWRDAVRARGQQRGRW